MAGWICAACSGENPEGMRFCGHCGAPAAGAPPPAEPERPAPSLDDSLRNFVSGPVADRLEEAGGELPEERRLITALFADISGFTPLADKLDPEELLEVIDPVVSGLSSIVARYEGYVEKYAGDALLALFGAPVSHDDDAERAVRVANEMHAELARMRESLPDDAQGLTLHVGVNSGHGIARVLGSEARTDYAVLGDSVILAQRLESAAPPGETYVSDATYRLARSRFEFEPVGELTLKGKAEAVRAWRVVGERAETADRPATRLVGRTEELKALTGRLDELAAGHASLLSITGEPGVGKSRLTQELERHALDRGLQWLQGRCLSYGAALAYWPYVELLRRVAGITLDDRSADAATRLAAAVPERAAPFFARLLGLPAGDDEVGGLEPEAFRRGLHSAFADWLAARGETAPVVLALEDLHWADEASLALTSELVRRLVDAPVAILLNARPEAAPAIEELPAADPLHLALQPLTQHDVEELVREMLGAPPPPQLAKLLGVRTGGNPFFAEELVRALQDAGSLVRDDGAWSMRPGWSADEVPPTIEEVLSARIDLLPRRAATVLQTAAVVGRRQRVGLLGAVAGEEDLDEAVTQLVDSGLLDRTTDEGEEAVAFHHALVLDVAYSRLLRRRRRELHLQVAEAAEDLYGAGDDTIALLARHLYLGGGGPKAVEYLLKAGERAKQLFANEEAIVHFEHAAELAPDDVSIRLQIADLRELIGDYDQALALYEAIRDETGDVAAWAGIASVLRGQGRYDDALASIEAAFRSELLRAADVRPLWLQRARILLLASNVEAAIEAAQAGLATSDERDLATGRLLLWLAAAEDVGGRLDDALEHGLGAQRIFEREGELRDLATALRILGDVHREAGRYDRAAETLHEGLAVAERVGSVEALGGCLINLGAVEYMRGNVDAGIEIERRAIEEFERVGYGDRATAYHNIAEMLSARGDYGEALDYAVRALELAREIRHSLAVGAALETMALIELARGDFPAAGARAEEAAESSLEGGVLPRARRALEIAAEAWEKAGEGERAREVSARARSLD